MTLARPLPRAFVVALAAYAAALTVFTVYIIREYDLAPLYAWMQPALIAAAWLSVLAAHRGRRDATAVLLLPTIASPWGYFYFGPVIAIVTAAWLFLSNKERRAAARSVVKPKRD